MLRRLNQPRAKFILESDSNLSSESVLLQQNRFQQLRNPSKSLNSIETLSKVIEFDLIF